MNLGYWALILIGDTILINLAYVFALLLRFEWEIPVVYLKANLELSVFITIIFLLSFYFFRLYNRVWRYAGTDELLSIGFSATIGSVATIVMLHFLPRLYIPRSIPVMAWLIIILLIGGSRFCWRLLFDYLKRAAPTKATPRRVLIVGAGDAGATVVRELRNHKGGVLEPAGFVDDDPARQKARILGLQVLGRREAIPYLVEKHEIAEIIIAIPSASGDTIRQIVSICRETPAKLRILPGLYELINGQVTINQIREVRVEDLLGREPVEVNLQEIAGYLSGKVIMVTGGAGSIGSELCRQVARFKPRTLVILDNSENGVFELEQELNINWPGLNLEVEVADIRDRAKVFYLLDSYHPEVVFHAAAHKHVPLMERHPEEAVKTNIFGTKNVAEAAIKSGVKTFVLISTDKAVNPTSVMGATKRVAEMVIQSLNRAGKTNFVAVRFGNVLGSRGSVIPVFQKQLAAGGPLTVTHPEMVRYFMTIPEAVQLVIQTGAMTKNGGIFILDMGKPVKIVDLARDLIRFSGLEVDRDVKIEITGIRPGEKLYEELLTSEERASATAHSRIFIARASEIDDVKLENFLHQFDPAQLIPSAEKFNLALKALIPEYRTLNGMTSGEAAVG